MMGVKQDSANRRVFLRINGLDKATKAGIRAGFFDFAKDLQIDTNREILRRPKKGQVYILRTKAGRRRRHVASASGETHANLSGVLRRSLSWKVTGTSKLEWGYGVLNVPAPDYAKYVEDGTRRMAPRPSLALGVKRNLRNAEVHFKNGILRRING